MHFYSSHLMGMTNSCELLISTAPDTFTHATVRNTAAAVHTFPESQGKQEAPVVVIRTTSAVASTIGSVTEIEGLKSTCRPQTVYVRQHFIQNVTLSCFNKSVQLPTSAVSVTLFTFVAEHRVAGLRPRAEAPLPLGARRPPLSIDTIFCPHSAQQQTHRKLRLRSNDERQTDRRTDGCSTVS